ncbi:MAG TPA: AMP-binding protein [Spirochaetia bacterium]|nr:AMP-binding protein [Spirochaetia bacterium]
MTPWAFLDGYRDKTFSGRWPTIPRLFEITCSRFPENPCFTAFEPETIHLDYRTVLDHVRGVARYLKERGIRKGDRVAVTGKNSPEWAIAYLGVLFAEAVVVPIDYQLKDAEIAGLIALSGAKMLFVDEERFDELSPNGKRQKGSILLGVVSLSPVRKPYVLDLRSDEKVELFSGAGLPTDAKELAAILYTSGTTGHAKGVMLTHENLVSDSILSQSLISVLPTDVFYALLPIHHSYTMLAVFIEAMATGASVVFAKRMAVKQILSDLKRGKITMLLGIPMLFNKLLKGILHGIREKGGLVYSLISALMSISGTIKKVLKVNPGKVLFGAVLKQASLDRIRVCICGGGPLPPETFRKFNQLGINFVQGYGLTETSPIVTLNPTDHYKESSVGKVIPEIEVRIADPDEQGIGEILVRGSIVMQGYYQNDEATAEAFTKDGYLKTGDVGFLDDENYLYLTGRKKNMIVTEGGKNVFPEEIEDLFQLYEEIEQVLVKGYIKDTAMQIEAIEALVFPSFDYLREAAQKAGRTADDEYVKDRIDEVIAQVNQQLLPYKRISRSTVLSEAMEETTTKKIKRFTVTADSQ